MKIIKAYRATVLRKFPTGSYGPDSELLKLLKEMFGYDDSVDEAVVDIGGHVGVGDSSVPAHYRYRWLPVSAMCELSRRVR